MIFILYRSMVVDTPGKVSVGLPLVRLARATISLYISCFSIMYHTSDDGKTSASCCGRVYVYQ